MLYVFEDYELDTQLYELRHAGKPLKIEPQVFNVLTYLIEYHDRTVTKQELLENLWPEQFISEAVLSYCIMTARKAVGDNGRTQRVIKTLHGRGFRFIAPLEESLHGLSEADVATTPETPLLAEQQSLDDDEEPSVAAPLVTLSSPPSSTLGGENRPVTVLCATLVNAAALGEQLGFDEFQRLRQAFFALAQDEAQRHEGSLQFFGADGVLVLFGAPIVCKDHARRAVLAATELQRRLRERGADPDTRQTVKLAVRMGLHTGPVAIDSIPDDQRIASTEMGQTMHLAIWLQYLAEPGTLLTSEATMRQAPGAVPCATPRKVHIPGQSQPVRAYTMRESGL